MSKVEFLVSYTADYATLNGEIVKRTVSDAVAIFGAERVLGPGADYEKHSDLLAYRIFAGSKVGETFDQADNYMRSGLLHADAQIEALQRGYSVTDRERILVNATVARVK